MAKVLVVAVHPDDETLGCGGALLKHKSKGDEIYWLIVTNMSVEHGWSEMQVRQRQKEIGRVAKKYGFKKTFKLNFPPAKLDQVPGHELIRQIAKVIKEAKPATIYIPHHGDIHTDHQVAFHAALSCTKNFRYPFIERILTYETLSETEFAPALSAHVFVPNVFVDISNFLKKKTAIFKLYASEVMEAPFPRSIETVAALARLRGSRIGRGYAEAFCLLFERG